MTYQHQLKSILLSTFIGKQSSKASLVRSEGRICNVQSKEVTQEL